MSNVSLQEGVSAGTRSQQQVNAQKSSRWRTDLTGLAFMLPFLLVYAIFVAWPILFGFSMSFFNWTIGGNGASRFLGLGNYGELFGDPAFWRSIGVTVAFTIISTPILVILAFVLALLVNRAIPARGLFRSVFFAPFVLPASVVTLIWGWLYQTDFGLIDGTISALGLKQIPWLSDPTSAMSAIIILTVWWTVGYNFVLYLAAMQQLPRELQEAASIDGAGYWARLRWITIPLLNPYTALIVILQVIASLQLFSQNYLLTAVGPNYATRSAIQYIYDSGFTSFRLGYASAMSYILFLLILIISLTQFSVFMRQRRSA